MAVAVIDPKIFNQVNDSLDKLRTVLEVDQSTKIPFYSFLSWYVPLAEKVRLGRVTIQEGSAALRSGGVVAIKKMLGAVQLLQRKLQRRLNDAFLRNDRSGIIDERENLRLIRGLENDVLGCSSTVMGQLKAGLLAFVQTVNRMSSYQQVTQGMRELEGELSSECLDIRSQALRE